MSNVKNVFVRLTSIPVSGLIVFATKWVPSLKAFLSSTEVPNQTETLHIHNP